MLTPRHLSILRAALQFFDEEISPHGPEVAQPYFEDSLEEPLQPEETGQLRELLGTVELRYLRCDRKRTRILREELLTFEQTQSSPDLQVRHIVTVFLTSSP